jgi:hypothetical protein
MSGRQTRSFVPSAEPNEDWSETLIGKVLRPIATEFTARFDSFWSSRYSCPVHVDTGDCDFASAADPDFQDKTQRLGSGVPTHLADDAGVLVSSMLPEIVQTSDSCWPLTLLEEPAFTLSIMTPEPVSGQTT